MDLIKKYNNVVLFFLDIALTVICASVVYLILHHDIAKESLQLWVISMILFWQVTREPEKIFIQGYRHIIRLLFFAVSATVIYLFIFRISYSLRALVSVSFLWMIFASLGRFLLIKYLPNRIIAGDKDIIDKLMDDEKIKNNKLFSVLTLTDLSKLDFKDFDYVIFDPQHDYDEKWRNFFVHAKFLYMLFMK